MYKGSCLCQGVAIELHGGISSVIHCHCSKCRKNSGTAYATNGFIQRDDLKVVRGAELLSQFETSAGKLRHFCKICGSPVYSENLAAPERLRIRLGIFDSDITERPQSHNFIGSKANWDEPDADLPRYDEFEPGRR